MGLNDDGKGQRRTIEEEKRVHNSCRERDIPNVLFQTKGKKNVKFLSQ